MEIIVLDGISAEVEMTLTKGEFELLRDTFQMGVGESNFNYGEGAIIDQMTKKMQDVTFKEN